MSDAIASSPSKTVTDGSASSKPPKLRSWHRRFRGGGTQADEELSVALDNARVEVPLDKFKRPPPLGESAEQFEEAEEEVAEVEGDVVSPSRLAVSE